MTTPAGHAKLPDQGHAASTDHAANTGQPASTGQAAEAAKPACGVCGQQAAQQADTEPVTLFHEHDPGRPALPVCGRRPCLLAAHTMDYYSAAEVTLRRLARN